MPVLTHQDATEVIRAAYSSSQQRWDLERPVRYAYCDRSTEQWWQGFRGGSWGQISNEGVPDQMESYAYQSRGNQPLYRVFACSNDTGQVLREEGWVDGVTGELIAKVPVEVPSEISSCDYYWP